MSYLFKYSGMRMDGSGKLEVGSYPRSWAPH